jgi:integrase
MWFRESRGAWFTTIDNQQVNLGKHKAEAARKFHELQAGRVGAGRDLIRGITVAELADDWLEHKHKLVRPPTFKNYRHYCRLLAKAVGRVKAADLRPYNVTRWIDSQKDWNQSTRHEAITIVKMPFAWGYAQGILDRNVLASLRAPTMLRRPPLHEDDYAKLLAAIERDDFRDLVEVSIETGCRPGELYGLTAHDVDLAAGRINVSGKTGPRIAFLSPRAAEILGRLMTAHPTGPLLRNSRGDRWTNAAVGNLFRRRIQPAGVPAVLYQLRGLFASRMVRKGVDVLTLMHLMGHKNTTPLAKHYVAVTDDQLRKAVNRPTGDADADTRDDRPDTPQGPPPPP